MRTSISSWTVEGYLTSNVTVPEFQRKLVYSPVQQAMLVASALKGLFLGCITIHKETGHVIDGQQRTDVFNKVVNDDFVATKNMFKGVPENFNSLIPTAIFNKPFSEWSTKHRDKFLNATIVICEIFQCPEEEARMQYWMMNTNMMTLNSEEKRKAITEGGIITDYKKIIAKWPQWARIFPASQINRLRVEEFASELLLLVITGKPGDKKKKLTDFVETNNKSKSSIVKESLNYLKDICEVVNSILPEKRGRKHFHRYTHYYTMCHVIMNMINNGMVLKNAIAAKKELALFQAALNRPYSTKNDYDIEIYNNNSIQASDSMQARAQRMGVLQNRLMKHFKSI